MKKRYVALGIAAGAFGILWIGLAGSALRMASAPAMESDNSVYQRYRTASALCIKPLDGSLLPRDEQALKATACRLADEASLTLVRRGADR